LQSRSQPSSGWPLPSSHSSPAAACVTPSPHTGAGGGVVVGAGVVVGGSAAQPRFSHVSPARILVSGAGQGARGGSAPVGNACGV
jgi:hypothetical protein